MICFDHAAAETVLPEIQKNFAVLAQKYSGNIESAHQTGYVLRQALEHFTDQLFDAFLPRAPKDKRAAFFAYDATDLINALGVILSSNHACAWGSALDHPALEQMLKRSFANCQYMSIDSCGRIDAFPEKRQEVRLISIPYVQSETGVRQDIAELIRSLREAAPEALILLDAVQSAPWYDYPENALPADLLLVSGSKLGAGSGAALLAVNDCVPFFRHGFEKLRKEQHLIAKVNMLSAAMLASAAEITCRNRSERLEKVTEINQFLREKLAFYTMPNGKRLCVTLNKDIAAGNILHLTLPGYQSGVLVRMFSQEGIMLSAGSACQAETSEPSRILRAMKYSKNDAFSGLRLSFSDANTLAEAEIFLEKLDLLLKNY